MSLKECVECAFGTDAENRILHFLVEKELHNCGNDADRWLVLFGKCEQWRNEVTDLLNKSWELYQKFPKNSISYQKDMELNYPKFDEALEYLAQNVGACEVVRMNQHGGDEAVWYFVKAQDFFYLMYLSDSM